MNIKSFILLNFGKGALTRTTLLLSHIFNYYNSKFFNISINLKPSHSLFALATEHFPFFTFRKRNYKRKPIFWYMTPQRQVIQYAIKLRKRKHYSSPFSSKLLRRFANPLILEFFSVPSNTTYTYNNKFDIIKSQNYQIDANLYKFYNDIRFRLNTSWNRSFS